MGNQLFPDDPTVKTDFSDDQLRLITAQQNINQVREFYAKNSTLTSDTLGKYDDEDLCYLQNLMADTARLLLMAGVEMGVEQVKEGVQIIERHIATDENVAERELAVTLFSVANVKPMSQI